MIFFEKKSQVLCKEEHGSIHPIISHQSITQIAWGPYEDICSQELERMQGIKSMQVYSWKCMECTRRLARFIEFNFSDQHAICLNSRKREFEGSVAQTFVCRGRRGNYPGLQRVGLSMLCNMLGERSRTSLHLVILRDLPRTYSCTCFYSKEKQWWKQTRTLPVLNTGESKLY